MNLFGVANRSIKAYSNKAAFQLAKERKKAENKLYRELWEKERKHYYLQARNQFNMLCHQGKIKFEQQQKLIHMLEKMLGEYRKEINVQFDNDYHKIYTYMKSWHLDESDWDRILTYLDQIEHSRL